MTDVLYFASFAGAIDEQLVGEMPPCVVLLFQHDNSGDICSVFVLTGEHSSPLLSLYIFYPIYIMSYLSPYPNR